MRNNFFKSLLVGSTLLFTAQQSSAEQPPVWGVNQAPIAWGDCIPVPVNSMPFPMNSMTMGTAPSGPMPMMLPFPSAPAPYMMPMNEQPMLLPPPSPFFNTPPNLIPAPAMPSTPPVVCGDPSKKELDALQARYNQASSLSRTKFQEINQALSDAHNQMADARVIIDTLSKEKENSKTGNLNAISEFKMHLAALDNTNKSLQAKLSTFESDAGAQARKITVLNQSAAELVALQSAYKTRNDENAELKKKLADLDGTYKTLKSQLSSCMADAGAQARKLTALGQASTELTGLKSAYQARNNENAELKKKLADLDGSYKTLKSQLSTSMADAGAQARKLTALGQASTELTGLKSAYQARNNENAELKKKLADLDGSYKSLQSQLSTTMTESGAQARKLTALSQASSELTALKSAYKSRNDETVGLKKELTGLNTKLSALQIQATLKGAQDNDTIKGLKKKLASFDNSNKTLQTRLGAFEADAGAQTRKLAALTKSTVELTALRSAYKARNDEALALKGKLKTRDEEANSCKFEVADLKKKIAGSDNDRKSLLGKIVTLESTSSSQTRKINALMATSLELEGLRSAYKDLSSKKVELTSKLTAATADADKDGVLDKNDKCPFSLAGEEVNAIGCFADADNDGIANSKDDCSASPIGSHVNEKGCPKIVDTDGDTVADASDLCPATAAGITVNEFGCEPTENITLKGVNFATGSARLTNASLPILNAAAETLNKSKNLNVEIAGYTDNQGAGYINKRLSQRRANTVMIELIKNGVDANRLSAKGYGESNPVATNGTEGGRSTNRRVELKIRK